MHYLLIFIFLIIVPVSRAQQGIDLDYFYHFAGEMNFTFKIPDGYFPFNFKEKYSHSCRGNIMIGSPNYAIQNKNKSIAIAFRIGNWYKRDTVVASKMIRKRNPEWTVDYDYFHVGKSYADTIEHSIIKLPTEFAKTNFNGSDAIELVSFCTHRYLGMPYDKIYNVSKKGRGYVSIAFYYNDEAKDEIDLEIDRVLKSKMIYFNDQKLIMFKMFGGIDRPNGYCVFDCISMLRNGNEIESYSLYSGYADSASYDPQYSGSGELIGIGISGNGVLEMMGQGSSYTSAGAFFANFSQSGMVYIDNGDGTNHAVVVSNVSG